MALAAFQIAKDDLAGLNSIGRSCKSPAHSAQRYQRTAYHDPATQWTAPSAQSPQGIRRRLAPQHHAAAVQNGVIGAADGGQFVLRHRRQRRRPYPGNDRTQVEFQFVQLVQCRSRDRATTARCARLAAGAVSNVILFAGT